VRENAYLCIFKLLKTSIMASSIGFKNNIVLFLFGKSVLEAFYADYLLNKFKDGHPRTSGMALTGEFTWIAPRILDLVISDNFLKPFGEGYIITARGIIHLNKGGYIGQYIGHKCMSLTLAFSLLATVLSIIAIIRSF
jgi:hypothetical protein